MRTKLIQTSYLLLAIFLSGCAMKSTRVSVLSDQPPEVLICGDALQTSIGVAPLVDQRPPVEKAGDKPRGIFLLFWNQRIGNYITSNRDFLDPVVESMPEQTAYHLSRTNCFFETKVLKSKVPNQPSPQDLLVFLAKEKVRYVLLGELLHFYGMQRQKAYFYALPAFFVNLYGWGSETGISEGKTEILFTLYDTEIGYEVWREKIIGESTSLIQGSYPQVAKESFHQATQKLANQLYRFAQLREEPVVLERMNRP